MGKVLYALMVLGLGAGACTANASGRAPTGPEATQPAPTASTAPSASAASAASSASTASSATALAEPTRAPAPAPTPTPSLTVGPLPAPTVSRTTVAAAPLASSTPQQVSASNTRTPDATVRFFYDLLAERQYAELRGLMTGQAYASLIDVTTLSDRTPPGKLSVDRADVLDLDPSGNRAVVAVDVVEQLASGPLGTRHYTGTWTLERGPSGWLLAESDLQVR